MKPLRGYLYALLTSVLWASTAAVCKIVLTNLDSFQVLFYSTLFASLTLLAVAAVQGKLGLLKFYRLRDYATFALMGFLGVFFYMVCLQAALTRMPAQEAFIVNYTWPIMTVVFAWLILKEKLGARLIAGLFLSFVGVVIVATKGDFTALHFSVSGVLWATAGAITYGLFSVLGKRQNYDKIVSTACFFVFGFLFSAAATLMFSRVPALSGGQVTGLLWLGVFPNGIGFIFWLLALKDGNTAKIANLMFLTPFLSLVYIYFLLGERILPSSIVGLVFIVAGAAVQSIRRRVRG